MRLGSLFSGYGGLDLAVENVLGTTTAWVSDIDKGANKILAHHYPDTPNLGDISTVNWADVEPVDVLTGGFPCQDLSHAGKRAGLRPDTRSGLWTQMAYAIDQLRPRLVVAENVRGLLSAEAHSDVEPCPWCLGDRPSGHLRALGAVLGDLADLGYDASWHGLRAADVGACHGRFRIFLVAHPTGDSRRVIDGEHRTPQDADLTTGGEWWESAPRQTEGGRARADAGRRDRAPLMPTPRATDGTKGGPNQRGSSGDLMLPSAVTHLLPTPLTTTADGVQELERRVGGRDSRMLPTPTSRNYKDSQIRREPHRPDDEDTLSRALVPLLPTPRAARGASGTETMYGLGAERSDDSRPQGEVLIPTPSVADALGGHERRGGARGDELLLNGMAKAGHLERFGQYAAAIGRWETTVGREAPSPTEPTGRGDAHRLSPAFVEWMMGLPAGHVTDVPDLTRNEQLKALGNGVVPQQAEAALRLLLPMAVAA